MLEKASSSQSSSDSMEADEELAGPMEPPERCSAAAMHDEALFWSKLREVQASRTLQRGQISVSWVC